MNTKKLKKEAKEILNNNLGKIIKPYLIISILSFLLLLIFESPERNPIQDLSINIITSIILYPLNIGLISYILKIIRKENPSEKEIYSFYNKFIYLAGLTILISLFTTLWSFLFIIPGIIASINYTMAPYLIIDYDEDPLRCIDNSKKMMKGYRWDYFKFILSFFGWFFIYIFAFWYITPYIMISRTLYYEELKKITEID